MTDFCCDDMRVHCTFDCELHKGDPFGCPDAVIGKFFGRYGLLIHDGGSSYLKIEFCPWCGSKL